MRCLESYTAETGCSQPRRALECALSLMAIALQREKELKEGISGDSPCSRELIPLVERLLVACEERRSRHSSSADSDPFPLVSCECLWDLIATVEVAKLSSMALAKLLAATYLDCALEWPASLESLLPELKPFQAGEFKLLSPWSQGKVSTQRSSSSLISLSFTPLAQHPWRRTHGPSPRCL